MWGQRGASAEALLTKPIGFGIDMRVERAAPWNFSDFVAVREAVSGPKRSRQLFAFVSAVGGVTAAPSDDGRGS
jgi:hypothetical protein